MPEVPEEKPIQEWRHLTLRLYSERLILEAMRQTSNNDKLDQTQAPPQVH